MQIETIGLHPATELCLSALQWLQEQQDFHNVLDMACGGGILSVLCAHLWECRILAADISEKAVADTQERTKAEGLEDIIHILRSDGFKDKEITARAPYDLILINLLAEPIASWAGDVKKYLAPEGYVYLGGLLQWKATGIAGLYTDLGFEIVKEFSVSPWTGMVLRQKRHKTVTN